MTGSNCGSKHYFNKGLENSEMANYDLAVRDFSEAIALDPGNAEAYRNRGKAVLHGGFIPLMPYMKRKDYRNAIADFSHAIVLNPRNAAAYLDKGMAFLWRGEHSLLHRWGKGDYRNAIADFSHAIDFGRSDAKSFCLRGIAYSVLREYKLAVADLSRTIILDPRCAAAYFWRGFCSANLGNEDDSNENYKKAVELNPKLEIGSSWAMVFKSDIRWVGYDWPV